jgi:conjugal transfer pilus assembly protein TraV
MIKKTLQLLVCIVILSGCAVKAQYACGVPSNGVGCQTMSETHKQLSDGTLNSLYTEPFDPEASESEVSTDTPVQLRQGRGKQAGNGTNVSNGSLQPVTPIARQMDNIVSLQSQQAILSKPREMRIWFDRFTDTEGDLHDESFIFIRIDDGHWVIDDKPVLY